MKAGLLAIQQGHPRLFHSHILCQHETASRRPQLAGELKTSPTKPQTAFQTGSIIMVMLADSNSNTIGHWALGIWAFGTLLKHLEHTMFVNFFSALNIRPHVSHIWLVINKFLCVNFRFMAIQYITQASVNQLTSLEES